MRCFSSKKCQKFGKVDNLATFLVHFPEKNVKKIGKVGNLAIQCQNRYGPLSRPQKNKYRGNLSNKVILDLSLCKIDQGILVIWVIQTI